jgi:hypothetical protein
MRRQDVVRFEGWVSRELPADILRSANAGIAAQKASPVLAFRSNQ